VKALSYASTPDSTSQVHTGPGGNTAMTGSSRAPSTGKVAVIGAGPYGLAVTSHLREAGVQARVFGEVMGFWRHMPKGMLVRSEWRGTHIADPHRMLTLDRYEAEHGARLPRQRLRRDDVIAYGLWYQRRALPDVDERRVTRLEAGRAGFRLTLGDGDVAEAERVVVATGLTSFASRPPAFAAIPSTLAPHSCDVQDPDSFRGLRVVIVGAGQSALELAALLREADADVEVFARGPAIRWRSDGDNWLRRHTEFRKVIYPPGGVGPLGPNWIIQMPGLFRSLPAKLQQRWRQRAMRPEGSRWLQPRLSDIPMTAGRSVVSASQVGERLRLVFDDGGEREVDRVVLGTGYRVDLDRSSILAPELARSVRRIGGSPLLSDGFQSSVPGLHFVGAAAAESFGPLMFFIAGTGYAARALTRCIAN
jgi:NADPH-dependent 2,4-dienoyl-CoA reductase/sulfur reductase-like enzyme